MVDRGEQEHDQPLDHRRRQRPDARTRRLTTAAAADTAPAWSPDGERIAFVSKRGADQANALYIIRHDGGEAERIVELPYAILTPKWLPDSKHVGEQQPMVRIEPKPAELVQRSRPRLCHLNTSEEIRTFQGTAKDYPESNCDSTRRVSSETRERGR